MIRFLRLLPILMLTGIANGDGGIVRISQQNGPWMVTVFSSPTPFRVGPVDLSVLVQDADTRQTVFDVDVNLMLRHDTADLILVEATREAATNQLLTAALFDLPASTQDNAQLHFLLEADPPLPKVLELWPWLSIPLLAAMLFILHQWLVRSRSTRTTPPEPHEP